MSAQALDGGLLMEGAPLRMVYMDEAGTSANEPVAIVAAIVVHADEQWRPAVEYLEFLLNRYVPHELREGFIFHAKDLYQGGKKKEYKDSWPFHQRLRLMAKIMAIPRRFNLPVVFGYFRREVTEDTAVRHQAAFAVCLKRVNDFIKDNYPRENGMVIAENCEHMRVYLERVSLLFEESDLVEFNKRPYDAIIDEIFFVDKHKAPLIQIADHVAFAIRRSLAGYAHSEIFLDALYKNSRLSEEMVTRRTSEAGSGVVFQKPRFYQAPTLGYSFSSYQRASEQAS